MLGFLFGVFVVGFVEYTASDKYSPDPLKFIGCMHLILTAATLTPHLGQAIVRG